MPPLIYADVRSDMIGFELTSTAKLKQRGRSYSFVRLYPFDFQLMKKANIALDFIFLQINLKYVWNQHGCDSQST